MRKYSPKYKITRVKILVPPTCKQNLLLDHDYCTEKYTNHTAKIVWKNQGVFRCTHFDQRFQTTTREFVVITEIMFEFSTIICGNFIGFENKFPNTSTLA